MVVCGSVVVALFGVLLRLLPPMNGVKPDWLYWWRVGPKYAVVCKTAAWSYAIATAFLVWHFAHPSSWKEWLLAMLWTFLSGLAYHEMLYKQPGWWRHYKYSHSKDSRESTDTDSPTRAH